jgi:hypothetical protein
LIGAFINHLREEEADIIEPSASVELSPDPGDDPYCSCAEDGNADFLVTLNPKDCCFTGDIWRQLYQWPEGLAPRLHFLERKTVFRRQHRSSSSGMNSMNRTMTSSSREDFAKGTIWPSLKLRGSTQFTLIWPKPAAWRCEPRLRRCRSCRARP